MKSDFINLENYEQINGHKLADGFDNYVNSLSCDNEAAVNTMLKAENVEYYKKLSIAWIKKLHEMYTNRLYDGRNEYACKLGNAIYNAMTEYMGHAEDISVNDFITAMSRNHRTLQQSFSSIVFLFLSKIYEKELGTIDEMQYFTRCPLI